MKTTDWIQTYSGQKFYPLEPDPDAIYIDDIAHSLAMQCRYNGHTKKFYSVAQHSVILSQKFFRSLEMRRAALLHDASEAYLADIPRPLKRLPEFAFYREAEERLQRMIFRKFGVEINEAEWKLIQAYDHEIIYHEASSPELMYPTHPDWTMPIRKSLFEIEPWDPAGAEQVFLAAFHHMFEINNEEEMKVAA